MSTATSTSTSCAATGRSCSATAHPDGGALPPRRSADAGDCLQRPGRSDGRAGRAAGRRRRPRRLGDVRQERHRRHHDMRHGRPGGNRAAQGARRRAAPTTAPCPWCTPSLAGVTAEDQRPPACTFDYNDLEPSRRPPRRPATTWRRSSCRRSSHDVAPRPGAGRPGVRPRPARAICDDAGAALILDDVRARLPARPRRELGAARRAARTSPRGARRSPTATPLAAVTGNDRFRERRREHLRHRLVLVLGGGRWRPRVATIDALGAEDAVGQDGAHGTTLRDGLAAQARSARRRDQPDGPGADAADDVRRRPGLPIWPCCGPRRRRSAAPSSTPGTTGSSPPPTPRPTSTRRSGDGRGVRRRRPRPHRRCLQGAVALLEVDRSQRPGSVDTSPPGVISTPLTCSTQRTSSLRLFPGPAWRLAASYIVSARPA